jgi:hypothetical protein
MISLYLYFELPSFQHCLPSKLHVLLFPCYMKHSSLIVSLNYNNPNLCVQTHCRCNISWCDNEQQCVPLDYISNILGSYRTFQHLSFHNFYNPNFCDHIHYMRSNDHEKELHTFTLVSTLKVSLFLIFFEV